MNEQRLYMAIQAALKAGVEIMNVYTNPKANFEMERKADNSPLTIADKKSHRVIVEELAALPYPVLSEEGKEMPFDQRAKWNELWIVDPLDGTKEFIKRNGEFTVNIAFVRNGVPETGVIYIPVKQELYFADEKLGAYKLKDIASVSSSDSVENLMTHAEKLPYENEKQQDEFLIVASRSHMNEDTEHFIAEMECTHAFVKTVSKGSSLKLCLVAEGLADVYPRFAPTMEWDTAAGHAIVRAAGGEVYQAGTNVPLLYNKENLLNPWFIAYPEKMKQ